MPGARRPLADAERTLSRSYELDPGNPVTAYNLAEVLLQRGEFERARFYIGRVNESPTQSNAQSLWLAARIERKLGNRERRAGAWAASCATVIPQSPRGAGASSRGVSMSETAAGPTRSAGALLRAAREEQGLHIAALAAAIKVTPRKLDALENDRCDELPDATFTRALAQTVCRALKIDAGPGARTAAAGRRRSGAGPADRRA